jgi:DNA-binding XRE family transcriptional regulator
MKATGQDLKAARTEAGLTQKELAKLIGTTDKTIFNLEQREEIPAYYLQSALFSITILKFKTELSELGGITEKAIVGIQKLIKGLNGDKK